MQQQCGAAHWKEFGSAKICNKDKLPAADIGRTIKLSFGKEMQPNLNSTTSSWQKQLERMAKWGYNFADNHSGEM